MHAISVVTTRIGLTNQLKLNSFEFSVFFRLQMLCRKSLWKTLSSFCRYMLE